MRLVKLRADRPLLADFSARSTTTLSIKIVGKGQAQSKVFGLLFYANI